MTSEEELEYLLERLNSWEFSRADSVKQSAPEELQCIIQSLAEMFGNCVWTYGAMGAILAYVVNNLIKEIKDSYDESKGL